MSLPYSSTANLPFGSPTLTIGGVTYRTQGFTLPRPTREIRRDDTNGDRAEFQVRAEPITGTATLQLATSATSIPTGGATFTGGGAALVVTDVSKVEPQGDFWTVEIGYTAAT